MSAPVLVKVCDPESGEVLDSAVIDNNYVVICAGHYYVDTENRYANGTVQLTLKVARDG